MANLMYKDMLSLIEMMNAVSENVFSWSSSVLKSDKTKKEISYKLRNNSLIQMKAKKTECLDQNHSYDYDFEVAFNLNGKPLKIYWFVPLEDYYIKAYNVRWVLHKMEEALLYRIEEDERKLKEDKEILNLFKKTLDK